MSLTKFLLRFACLSLLLATSLSATISSSAEKKDSLPFPLQLKIWQCRQRCYRQTLPESTPASQCQSHPDCYMCHDYCRVLAIAEWSLAMAMCSDRIYCTRGCRTACKFHRHYTSV